MITRIPGIPEVPLVSIEEHLRKRQEMYFGSRGADPQAIVSSIAEGALILGATKIRIEEKSGWWYVCANLDWFEVPTIPQLTPEKVFEAPWGFPQGGINWYRSEVMARVFSTGTFTVKDGNKVWRVSGELPPDSDIIEQIKFLGSWARVLGFKFQNAA